MSAGRKAAAVGSPLRLEWVREARLPLFPNRPAPHNPFPKRPPPGPQISNVVSLSTQPVSATQRDLVIDEPTYSAAAATMPDPLNDSISSISSDDSLVPLKSPRNNPLLPPMRQAVSNPAGIVHSDESQLGWPNASVSHTDAFPTDQLGAAEFRRLDSSEPPWDRDAPLPPIFDATPSPPVDDFGAQLNSFATAAKPPSSVKRRSIDDDTTDTNNNGKGKTPVVRNKLADKHLVKKKKSGEKGKRKLLVVKIPATSSSKSKTTPPSNSAARTPPRSTPKPSPMRSSTPQPQPEIFDISDSDSDDGIQITEELSRPPVHRTEPGAPEQNSQFTKPASKTASLRFSNNSRLDPFVTTDPQLDRVTARLREKHRPRPGPIMVDPEAAPSGRYGAPTNLPFHRRRHLPIPPKVAYPGSRVRRERSPTELDDPPLPNARTSGPRETAAASSRGFNPIISRPDMTSRSRLPQSNTESLRNEYSKRTQREPMVQNSRSRATLASQFSANRNRMAQAERVGAEDNAARNEASGGSAQTFKRIQNVRKRPAPSAEAEPLRINSAGSSNGGLSDQLSQMSLEYDGMEENYNAVDELLSGPGSSKRPRLQDDQSTPPVISAEPFDIDRYVRPRAVSPVRRFDFDVPFRPPLQPALNQPSTSRNSYPPPRPSSSDKNRFERSIPCGPTIRQPQEPLPVDSRLSEVFKASAEKSAENAGRVSAERLRKSAKRHKPDKMRQQVHKDQFDSVANFELYLVTWRPEWIPTYLRQKRDILRSEFPFKLLPVCFSSSRFPGLQCIRQYSNIRDYDTLHMGIKAYEVFEELCKQKKGISHKVLILKISVDEEHHIANVLLQGVFVKTPNRAFDLFGDHWMVHLKLGESEYLAITTGGIIVKPIEIVSDLSPALQEMVNDPKHRDKELSLVSWTVRVHSTHNHKVTASDTEGGFAEFSLYENMNLVPAEREISALGCLRNHPLRHLILEPIKYEQHFIMEPSDAAVVKVGQERLNSSQLEVVNCVATDVFSRETPKIGLIHGPPGTGKSHVIVAILEEIQQRKMNANLLNKLVLVTAPSNAAVESLVTQLDARKRSSSKTNPFPKFVCVGNNFRRGSMSFRYSVEELVRIVETKKNDGSTGSRLPPSVAEELKRISDDLKTYSIFPPNEKTDEMRDRIGKLEADKARLERSNTPSTSHHQHSSRQHRIECRNIIQNADVVLATLNSSGLSWLDVILSEKDENGQDILLAVIIDEACQAVELETLIPLRWGTKKIFLIGDPRQLEPTVQSPVSKSKGYHQSMFQRFYESIGHPKLSDDGTQMVPPKTVKLLNVQYRMMEEIASFPNRHFYYGRIKTDSSVTCPPSLVKLRTYAFIDVSFGKEETLNNGFFNVAEIDVVVELIRQLKKVDSRADIGVITFYREQVRKLEHALRTELQITQGDSTVEINTVDSYQGREKSIVILSCVRAGNSIGFLDDPKRLNVALTRGKHLLYVVGHRRALTTEDYRRDHRERISDAGDHWKKLLEDAEQRGAIVRLDEDRDIDSLQKHLLKPVAEDMDLTD